MQSKGDNLILRLVSALIAMCCLFGCAPQQPAPWVPRFPKASAVKQLRGQILAPYSGAVSSEEFELPEEYIEPFLRFLQPAEYCVSDGPHYGQLARVIFVLHDGTQREAQLFFYGKHPSRFTFDGVPCARGGDNFALDPERNHYLPEANVIAGLLKDIQQGDTQAALKTIDELDRSAGRMGPHY